MLDIKQVTTKEQCLFHNMKPAIDFQYDKKYGPCKEWWVRYIQYPVSQEELDRVCKLSEGTIFNNMGDLYLKK